MVDYEVSERYNPGILRRFRPLKSFRDYLFIKPKFKFRYWQNKYGDKKIRLMSPKRTAERNLRLT